jgi:hypothetical protein
LKHANRALAPDAPKLKKGTPPLELAVDNLIVIDS